MTTLNQKVLQKILWWCSFWWNNLLIFTWLNMKFHNCLHATLHKANLIVAFRILANQRHVYHWYNFGPRHKFWNLCWRRRGPLDKICDLYRRQRISLWTLHLYVITLRYHQFKDYQLSYWRRASLWWCKFFLHQDIYI